MRPCVGGETRSWEGIHVRSLRLTNHDSNLACTYTHTDTALRGLCASGHWPLGTKEARFLVHARATPLLCFSCAALFDSAGRQRSHSLVCACPPLLYFSFAAPGLRRPAVCRACTLRAAHPDALSFLLLWCLGPRWPHFLDVGSKCRE